MFEQVQVHIAKDSQDHFERACRSGSFRPFSGRRCASNTEFAHIYVIRELLKTPDNAVVRHSVRFWLDSLRLSGFLPSLVRDTYVGLLGLWRQVTTSRLLTSY
jgi:hypothetical protein